jgi:hypothetical protein
MRDKIHEILLECCHMLCGEGVGYNAKCSVCKVQEMLNEQTALKVKCDQLRRRIRSQVAIDQREDTGVSIET